MELTGTIVHYGFHNIVLDKLLEYKICATQSAHFNRKKLVFLANVNNFRKKRPSRGYTCLILGRQVNEQVKQFRRKSMFTQRGK